MARTKASLPGGLRLADHLAVDYGYQRTPRGEPPQLRPERLSRAKDWRWRRRIVDLRLNSGAVDEECSDEALMLAYGGGDARAFVTLYGRHRGPLFRWLLHQGGERQPAEDLFQQVWTSVVSARAAYGGAPKFAVWLYRTAHERLHDCYRRNGRLAEFEAESAVIGDDRQAQPQTSAAAQPFPIEIGGIAARLVAAVHELPAPLREVFLLTAEGRFATDAIARITGDDVTTAAARLEAARSRLQEAFGEHSWLPEYAPGATQDELCRLYREGTRAEPTPMLDHAIVQVARTAVAVACRPVPRPWWKNWPSLLAMASVVALGLSINRRVDETASTQARSPEAAGQARPLGTAGEHARRPAAFGPAYEASPQQWLERIRGLRAAGRAAEAAANLARLKRRYPDYPVPEDLK